MSRPHARSVEARICAGAIEVVYEFSIQPFGARTKRERKVMVEYLAGFRPGMVIFNGARLIEPVEAPLAREGEP